MYVTHPNNSNHNGSNLIFNTRYIILKSTIRLTKSWNKKAHNDILSVSNIIDNAPNIKKQVSYSSNDEQQGTCQCVYVFV